MESVIVAIITGGLSLVGVIVTNILSNKKIESEIIKNQAVTDTKLEELTREVREHNNFAIRIPVLEQRVSALEKKMEQ